MEELCAAVAKRDGALGAEFKAARTPTQVLSVGANGSSGSRAQRRRVGGVGALMIEVAGASCVVC